MVGPPFPARTYRSARVADFRAGSVSDWDLRGLFTISAITSKRHPIPAMISVKTPPTRSVSDMVVPFIRYTCSVKNVSR